MDELPPSLLIEPVPVIALLGVSHCHNLVIKHLSHNTSEDHRCCFNVLTQPLGWTLTARKNNRKTTSSTAGILKAGWLQKHNNYSPAAVVVLLDSMDASIVAEVKATKTSAANREVSTIVCWVTEGASRPVPQNASDIFKQELLIIDTAAPAEGVGRLEARCRAQANIFYRSRLRRLKKNRARDHNRIRSFFKSGFYCELKALKAYGFAFDYLVARVNDTKNVREVKTVAGFVSIRMLCLLSRSGNPAKGMFKFRNCMSTFKGAIGNPEFEYRHWSWLAHLYAAAGEIIGGDLIDSAYAFRTAAYFTVKRRCSAISLSERERPASLPATDDLPESPLRVDPARQQFVGGLMQNRSAHPLAAVGMSVAMEDEEDAALELAKELNCHHTRLVIGFLQRSFQCFRSLGERYRRHQFDTVMALADEHFAAGEHEVALKFYSQIANNPEFNSWREIVTHIHDRAAVCCREAGDTRGYLSHAIPAGYPLSSIKSKAELLTEELRIVADVPLFAIECRLFAVDGEQDVVHFELKLDHSVSRVDIEIQGGVIDTCESENEDRIRRGTIKVDRLVVACPSVTVWLGLLSVVLPVSGALLRTKGPNPSLTLEILETPDLWIEEDVHEVRLLVSNVGQETFVDPEITGSMEIEHDAIGELPPGASATVGARLVFFTFGDQRATLTINNAFTVELPLKLHKPFDCSFSLHFYPSMKPLLGAKVPLGDLVMLRTLLKCTATVPLQILSCGGADQPPDTDLMPGSSFVHWKVCKGNNPFVITWQRQGDTPHTVSSTREPPEIPFTQSPQFEYRLDFPTRASFGQPFTVELTLNNRTGVDQQLTLNVVSSSAQRCFLVDGLMKSAVRALPGEVTLAFTLVPLVTGSVPLPFFIVKWENATESPVTLVDSSTIRRVFVK